MRLPDRGLEGSEGGPAPRNTKKRRGGITSPTVGGRRPRFIEKKSVAAWRIRPDRNVSPRPTA